MLQGNGAKNKVNTVIHGSHTYPTNLSNNNIQKKTVRPEFLFVPSRYLPHSMVEGVLSEVPKHPPFPLGAIFRGMCTFHRVQSLCFILFFQKSTKKIKKKVRSSERFKSTKMLFSTTFFIQGIYPILIPKHTHTQMREKLFTACGM